MACVRSVTLPEARWAVCAATSLRRLRNGLPIRPYVSITSGMNSLCTAAALYLLFFSVSRFMMGSPLGAELPWRGRGWLVWLTAESMMWVMETSARIVMPVSRRPLTRMSGRRLLVLPSLFVVPGISPMGSVNVVKPPCLQIAWSANFTLSCVLCWLPPALLVWTQIRWSKAWRGSRAACGGLQQCARRWLLYASVRQGMGRSSFCRMRILQRCEAIWSRGSKGQTRCHVIAWGSRGSAFIITKVFKSK
mmetsp:Transcript_14249/g.62026  ORF Transcript_14249/g.62026 Transcript_14249/m.62026 type:complete len:249 (+) Transcript_14249:1947-2693(+)